MCGIVAFWGRGAFDADPFLRALAHRGPDASAAWSHDLPDDRSVHLGHRRLAILDLSPTGAQPMHDPATGNVIVFNGEIYNFADLRRELEAAGRTFRSSGDTEVLLQGYGAWGVEALCRKLDGIFAFVVFDPRRKVVAVARDHLGIKPLYQTPVPGGWLLASESRAIARSPHWRGRADLRSVADYLHFGVVQEPWTIFGGITSFPPGCWAESAVGDAHAAARLDPQPYWLAEREAARPGPTGDADHADLLRATVNEQLVSDVPVGVFLSAGVDSTLLLEMIDPAARARVKAFTVSGRVTENDEATLAAQTCRNLGVRHEVVRLDDTQVGAWVRDALDAMDQPTADAVNTYLVSRASKTTDIVVALGGTGADELHGGYNHFTGLAKLDRFVRRGGWAGLAALKLGAALYGVRDPVAGDRLAALADEVGSPWGLLYEKRRYFTQRQLARYWPGGRGLQPRWEPPYRDRDAFESLDFHTQLAIAELRCFLGSMLLRDSDWATMANSQELRVPYLGRRYVEMALRIPWERKLPAGGRNKPLLANLVSEANRAVILRKKTGFHINYSGLLRVDFRDEVMEAFATLNGLLGFEIATARVMDDLARARSPHFSRRVWALFALGWFVRRNL